MLQIVQLVIPLFGLVFLGFLAGKLVRQPLEGLAWLNIFIVYIALPAMFFRLLSRTPISEFANFSFIAGATFATLLVFCLTFFVAGLLNRGNVGESTIQGFAGAYGNIGYMGPPLAIAAFGPVAGVPVALIFCFDNAMHFILAPLLMAFRGEGDVEPAALARQIATKIFTHPFILATIVGVAAAAIEFRPPAAIDRLLELLASAAAPCALFAMGVTAALRPLKRVPMELAYLVPIKLFLHPVIVFLVLIWVAPSTDIIWIEAAVLLAALPAATNVFVLAQQYDVWKERASSAVVVTTVLSVFTVTAYLYLAKSGYLVAAVDALTR